MSDVYSQEEQEGDPLDNRPSVGDCRIVAATHFATGTREEISEETINRCPSSMVETEGIPLAEALGDTEPATLDIASRYYKLYWFRKNSKLVVKDISEYIINAKVKFWDF